MARKSLEDIEQISTTELVELLHQENGQLRMQLLVQNILINRLKQYIEDEINNSDES